jgi:hypothetical protein
MFPLALNWINIRSDFNLLALETRSVEVNSSLSIHMFSMMKIPVILLIKTTLLHTLLVYGFYCDDFLVRTTRRNGCLTVSSCWIFFGVAVVCAVFVMAIVLS